MLPRTGCAAMDAPYETGYFDKICDAGLVSFLEEMTRIVGHALS